MHLVKNKYCFVSSISMNEHEMLLCVVERLAPKRTHWASKTATQTQSIYLSVCVPTQSFALHSVCCLLKCVCVSPQSNLSLHRFYPGQARFAVSLVVRASTIAALASAGTLAITRFSIYGAFDRVLTLLLLVGLRSASLSSSVSGSHIVAVTCS